MTQTKRGFVCVSSFCLVAKAPIFCFAEKRKNLQSLGGSAWSRRLLFSDLQKNAKTCSPSVEGLVAKTLIFWVTDKCKNLQSLGGKILSRGITCFRLQLRDCRHRLRVRRQGAMSPHNPCGRNSLLQGI